jgi:hypothetical protein
VMTGAILMPVPAEKCHGMADRATQPAVAAVKCKSLADMTEEEFARFVGSAPDWLEAAWAHAKEHGLDKMTMEEIDAEIEVYRREKYEAARSGNK